MNIALKHLILSLAISLFPAWLSGQCIGNVAWNGGTPAAGTLTANATILGTVAVQVRSAGSFAGARPSYTSIIEPYNGFTYQTLWISRGASFAAGTYTSYKLSTPLPPSLIHISVRDIRGDGINAEHQRVEGYLNGVPVAASFEDPVNGAFITGGNIINGAAGTTSLVQSGMRAFFTGPVDSIVVKATTWSDYVIVNLHVRCDILLPYLLRRFSAEAVEQGNMLRWEVQAEENVRAYAVQRSADGIRWQTIGQVNASTSQQQVRTYTFLDKDPYLPSSLYRIHSVEEYGIGSFSNVINVSRSAIARLSKVLFFPNPVRDKLQVLLPAGSGNQATAEIHASNGQRMLRQVIRGSAEMNLMHLPCGTYILLLHLPGEAIESHRIIIQ